MLISVTCHDGATMGEGSTQYKCKRCGKSLDSHTKECVMATTVTEDGPLDTSDLDEPEQEAQEHILALMAKGADEVLGQQYIEARLGGGDG